MPEARAPPPAPPPRAANVDSHTVRKHRTWRHRPGRHGQHGGDQRAALAGNVPAAVDPGGMQPQGLLHRRDAPFAHAHARRARVRRQAVDVTELQPGVGHGLQAGIDRQRERVDHEPPADGRAPHAAEHGPVLEAIGVQRRPGHRSLRRSDRIGDVRSTGRLEEWQPHVLALLEADHDLLPDVHVAGITAHDGGGEPDRRVLGDGHDGDDVGRVEGGMPAMLVHRVADDRAPAGDDRRLPLRAPAVRADRDRGMDEGGARRAALNAQLAIRPRGPEPLGGRRQLRQRPHRPAGPAGSGIMSPSVPMICGRSTEVRMPGAAAQTNGTALTARFAV